MYNAVSASMYPASGQYRPKMGRFRFLSLFFLLCLLHLKTVVGLPLHTDSSWIVDEDGVRVKLSCVNWPAQPEGAVAEGLSEHPVDLISQRIASKGFNCVRFSLPNLLATGQSPGSLTVRESLQKFGSVDSIDGFQVHNPSMLDLPLSNAFQAVVSSLAKHNLMVILDHHLSKRSIHGYQHLDLESWVEALSRMATMFSGEPHVVGISLRNELGCPKQNEKNWYRYMKKGAEAVHSANPDLLVIISGLGDGTDLSFLLKKQLELNFTGKLVLEMHWPGLPDGSAHETTDPEKVCGRVVDNIMKRGGVMLHHGWPLMFSAELGVDDNSHLNCFFDLAAELDFDWGLSTPKQKETDGSQKCSSSSFLKTISTLQSQLQGKEMPQSRRHKIIVHPSTGLCIVRGQVNEPLRLGPCTESDSWNYTPQKLLKVKGTYFCLQAVGPGKLARLSIICGNPGSSWDINSASKPYLSTKMEDGATLCLDVDSNNNIITDACKCSSGNGMCDPGSQWFNVADTSRPVLQLS